METHQEVSSMGGVEMRLVEASAIPKKRGGGRSSKYRAIVKEFEGSDFAIGEVVLGEGEKVDNVGQLLARASKGTDILVTRRGKRLFLERS